MPALAGGLLGDIRTSANAGAEVEFDSGLLRRTHKLVGMLAAGWTSIDPQP